MKMDSDPYPDDPDGPSGNPGQAASEWWQRHPYIDEDEEREKELLLVEHITLNPNEYLDNSDSLSEITGHEVRKKEFFFGISDSYMKSLEEGRRIQSRMLDNYLRLIFKLQNGS